MEYFLGIFCLSQHQGPRERRMMRIGVIMNVDHKLGSRRSLKLYKVIDHYNSNYRRHHHLYCQNLKKLSLIITPTIAH